jgi:hypothetical protein
MHIGKGALKELFDSAFSRFFVCQELLVRLLCLTGVFASPEQGAWPQNEIGGL